MERSNNQGPSKYYSDMAMDLEKQLNMQKQRLHLDENTMGAAGELFNKQYSISQVIEGLKYSLTDKDTNIFQKGINKIKLIGSENELKKINNKISTLPFNRKQFVDLKNNLEFSDQVLAKMKEGIYGGKVPNVEEVQKTIALLKRLNQK